MDVFLASVACGAEQIRIEKKTALCIGAVCSGVLLFSLVCGKLIDGVVREKYAMRSRPERSAGRPSCAISIRISQCRAAGGAGGVQLFGLADDLGGIHAAAPYSAVTLTIHSQLISF